jgi:hypothetical protein
MKTSLTILIAATIGMGLVYVVLPFTFDVYRRFRYWKVVTCPETHGLAEVRLNALLAGLTAVFHKPVLRVKSCTLWPRKKHCAQRCIKGNWLAE